MAAMAAAEAAGTRTLSEADFAVPRTDRYFEDYVTGAVYDYGYVSVTEPENRVQLLKAFSPVKVWLEASKAALPLNTDSGSLPEPLSWTS